MRSAVQGALRWEGNVLFQMSVNASENTLENCVGSATKGTILMTTQKCAFKSKRKATVTSLIPTQCTTLTLEIVSAVHHCSISHVVMPLVTSVQKEVDRVEVALAWRTLCVRLAAHATQDSSFQTAATARARTQLAANARHVLPDSSSQADARAKTMPSAQVRHDYGSSRLLMSCEVCRACPDKHYVSGGCDGIEDAICSACSEACPAGMTPTAPCSDTQDIVCERQCLSLSINLVVFNLRDAISLHCVSLRY